MNSGCYIGRLWAILGFYKHWANPPLPERDILTKKDQYIYDKPNILPQHQRSYHDIDVLWNARHSKHNYVGSPPATASNSARYLVYSLNDQFSASLLYIERTLNVTVDFQNLLFQSTMVWCFIL